MASGGKNEAHMLREGEEICTKYACRVYRTSRHLHFSYARTHWSYAVHWGDACAHTRFVRLSKKQSWPLEKSKSQQQNNNEQLKKGAQRSPQSGVHTAQRTSQQPGNPRLGYI